LEEEKKPGEMAESGAAKWQAVIALDMDSWQELIELYEIGQLLGLKDGTLRFLAITCKEFEICFQYNTFHSCTLLGIPWRTGWYVVMGLWYKS
jgi:hypothetical protein